MGFLYISLFIISVFIVYIINGYIQKTKLKKKFRGSYFDWENIEYEFDNLKIIRRYWDAKKNYDNPKEFIDDTTWDDLDMDYIFFAVNATQSSIGEEFLYAKLRETNFDISSLRKFGEAVNFMEDTNTRAEALYALNDLGKKLYNNVNSYIYKIDEQPIKNIQKYYILMALPLISAVLCVFTPVGIVFLVIAFIINTFVYYRDKYLVEMHLSSLSYISKMMRCADELSKLDYGTLDYAKRFREAIKPLRKLNGLGNALNRKAGFDFEFLFEYIKIVLMWDFINYNRMIRVLSKNVEAFHRIYILIGEIDCAISVYTYRKSLDFYSTPEFWDAKNIVCEEIYHPLIKKPVTNSIDWENNAIVTGSNASGKSTFVKALAINMIFSQSLYFCYAKKYSAKMSLVMTSMAVSDKVYAHESYFVAEIKSLKRIMDALAGDTRIVCFIDEILKGTNTIERIAASASILSHLAFENCLVMVASHDIELIEILGDIYDNYHFREQVLDEGIVFDYKLHDGFAQTRNAIRLLKFMGYDEEIVETANELASRFERERKWDVVGF